MAGISDKAVKTQYAENKYRYNAGSELQNKEFSDGSGVELYETAYRSYDPQLGRFAQADPLADGFSLVSTYQYGMDNPVLFNDPSGAYMARAAGLISASYGGNSDFGDDGAPNDRSVGGGLGGGGGFGGVGSGDNSGNSGFSNSSSQNSVDDIIGALMGYSDGGTWHNNSNGGYTYEFQSGDEAFAAGASDAFISGYWGTGANAIAGFNAAKQAYNAQTGENLQLNTPVVDIGHYNNGSWVTDNEGDLQNQLRANGALGIAGNADEQGIRLPDYISLNFSIGIELPFVGNVFGWSGNWSLDRYGNFYFSPIGVSVGKTAMFDVATSLTANWLTQNNTPSEAELNNFLTGNSISAGGGFGGGIQGTYSPSASQGSTGFGLFTPQAGFNWNYTPPGFVYHVQGVGW
ncbi:MAG TPA: RHS repeat-associated core domain-containing protein [Chitinophagaceae bacterium]|nr:RHS repeat-associated core domain-containing protein [Chitinophagaceae bacterium]